MSVNRLLPPPRPEGVQALSRLFLAQYHMRLLTLFGGTPGWRDIQVMDHVLEEALQVLGAQHDGDVFMLAACYATEICRRPYLEGNLRLATVAMATVIQLNGWVFRPRANELVATMQAVMGGELDREALRNWLLRQSTRLEDPASPSTRENSVGGPGPSSIG